MTQPPTQVMLETAMLNNELVLFYQPKVCLLSGSVIGAEALVRWDAGGQNVLTPSEFLPLAESCGLLHDLTLQLLDQAVAASTRLRHHAVNPDRAAPESIRAGSGLVVGGSSGNNVGTMIESLSISINVAPDDLASRTISDRIDELLRCSTISASDLQIEITESAVMGNVERVYDDLVRLKKLGIKILMDDFGTGYSSIDRLSQLPFDALKLDQGVVKRMGASRQNLNVVRASISMARELGMTSVAEGVESAAAYNFLIAHGCEEAQGYFIGRPMNLDDFMGFISAEHRFEGSHIGRVHQTTLNLMRFRKTMVDAIYCQRVGGKDTLASVSDPELRADISESRLGLWYFGIGQVLSAYPEFKRIEKPLRELHVSGLHFFALLGSGVVDTRVDLFLTEIDDQVDRVITLLHQLERVLLLDDGAQ